MSYTDRCKYLSKHTDAWQVWNVPQQMLGCDTFSIGVAYYQGRLVKVEAENAPMAVKNLALKIEPMEGIQHGC